MMTIYKAAKRKYQKVQQVVKEANIKAVDAEDKLSGGWMIS
jgi:hypothetical protein